MPWSSRPRFGWRDDWGPAALRWNRGRAFRCEPSHDGGRSSGKANFARRQPRPKENRADSASDGGRSGHGVAMVFSAGSPATHDPGDRLVVTPPTGPQADPSPIRSSATSLRPRTTRDVPGECEKPARRIREKTDGRGPTPRNSPAVDFTLIRECGGRDSQRLSLVMRLSRQGREGGGSAGRGGLGGVRGVEEDSGLPAHEGLLKKCCHVRHSERLAR
jgi:hypothetical protein